MKAILRIEAIGDDTVQYLRLWRSVINDNLPGVGNDVVGKMPIRYWVAQIIGRHAKYVWERQFLNGYKDYANSNSTGSRGIMVNYVLESGRVYEVKAPRSWRHTDRYFCRVTDDGDVLEIDESEVSLWLGNANHSA